ncbi:MAG: UDP-glucose dehydrogenase family protein [Bacteriovoracales bacterium]
MKIAIIGTGYVGLVSGTALAEIGHQVICIDVDNEKVNTLNKGICPLFEPGLEELIKRNQSSGRLNFSSKYEDIKGSEAIFIAVGTPSREDGHADLKYINEACLSLTPYILDDTLIILKSTVPVGTHKKIKDLIKAQTPKRFHLVSNPEFLKEGSAVEDFMRPDRVIVGTESSFANEKMEEIYSPLVRQGNPIIFMSNTSAELTKYAANCFLATKISFINEVANLCDLTGADIEEVRKGMASDKRIGNQFLYPGPGYGGSCFPKDVKALIHTAKEANMNFELAMAAEKVNKGQKVKMLEKISKFYKNDLNGKIFSFWGVAFKANTDDVRESAAIDMAKGLIAKGAKIQIYDPVAAKNFIKIMGETSIRVFSDKYDCLYDSCGLVTLTEWREFRVPDFKEIKFRLKHPVIFDARNLFDTEKVLSEGFLYFSMGKKVKDGFFSTSEATNFLQ